MLGKTIKRDNVIIKKKEENLPQKLQIYIKWTTKFKTLTVSKKKYMSHSRDTLHSYYVMSAAWEPHSNTMIQGTVVAYFPF